jgi:hypothetical protein
LFIHLFKVGYSLAVHITLLSLAFVRIKGNPDNFIKRSSEWSQGSGVEPPARLEVADEDPGVVDHSLPLDLGYTHIFLFYGSAQK